jgi:hypothetical protein|tara:strand:- start:36 stop:551 length:516 start_codon:yes stop_codon:yes gene_type:complete
MIIILDDVLSKNELENLNEGIDLKVSVDNNLNQYLRKWSDIKFAHPLLKISSKYFKLKRNYRYELWKHESSKFIPNWHFDKDEELYRITGVTDIPIFGLIYYPLIQSLKGGELILEDGTIINPRSNRMVLFSTGTIQHMVDSYQGYRKSFLINIWAKKNLGIPWLNIISSV